MIERLEGGEEGARRPNSISTNQCLNTNSVSLDGSGRIACGPPNLAGFALPAASKTSVTYCCEQRNTLQPISDGDFICTAISKTTVPLLCDFGLVCYLVRIKLIDKGDEGVAGRIAGP
jgi:hypothetical protein